MASTASTKELQPSFLLSSSVKRPEDMRDFLKRASKLPEGSNLHIAKKGVVDQKLILLIIDAIKINTFGHVYFDDILIFGATFKKFFERIRKIDKIAFNRCQMSEDIAACLVDVIPTKLEKSFEWHQNEQTPTKESILDLLVDALNENTKINTIVFDDGSMSEEQSSRLSEGAVTNVALRRFSVRCEKFTDQRAVQTVLTNMKKSKVEKIEVTCNSDVLTAEAWNDLGHFMDLVEKKNKIQNRVKELNDKHGYFLVFEDEEGVVTQSDDESSESYEASSDSEE